MLQAIKNLKRWEAYPSGIVSALAQWIAPFRHLDIINTRWRPDIDLVADGVVVLYVLWLTQEDLGLLTKATRKQWLKICAGVALGATLLCYLIRKYIIHWVDPMIAPLVDVVWWVLYITIFLAIVRFVFTALCVRLPEPPPPSPTPNT